MGYLMVSALVFVSACSWMNPKVIKEVIDVVEAIGETYDEEEGDKNSPSP